jgi:hypothetical protein
MFKRSCQAAKWLLGCAAVVTLAGCSMLTPEWHPRRVAGSECPADAMNYCVINNYGKRCSCMRRESVEAMTRSQ